MTAGSIVLGITVLLFAGWLQWNDSHGWHSESFATELDRDYLSRRKRARLRIHVIIAACGVLILVAAAAGPGAIWIAAWMSVMVALMVVVILAGLDALRTHRYQQEKLPQIRREILGDDE